MQLKGNLQNKTQPPRLLAPDQRWDFPPLTITGLEREAKLRTEYYADALLKMEYESQSFTFAAEYKANWQERDFRAVLEQARHYASGEYRPLVVLPYLSEAHLDALAAHQMSGLDLCGNGLILVPGCWLIRQSGKPNRFQLEQTLRNPYQGKASLVGRTLLQQSTYSKLDELHAEILRRGGNISLALVSRAVQRLEEDVITLRQEGSRVKLVQPEKLLDTLVRAYEPRRVRQVWCGKLPTPEKALPHLFAQAAKHNRRVIITGIGSATRYAPLAMESTVRIYLTPEGGVENFLSELGATPTDRFVNLEVYAYPDETCFFEGERDDDGVIWASPFQAYLEMMQSNDIRLKESASAIRNRILGEALAIH